MRQGSPQASSPVGRPARVRAFLPLLIAAGLAAIAIRTVELARREVPETADLRIIAHRGWWELQYPGRGLLTANEVHLPAGIGLETALRTEDVTRTFRLPELGASLLLEPGREYRIRLASRLPGAWLSRDSAGAPPGMRLRVVAEAPADFAAWVLRQRMPPPAPESASPGAALFQQLPCAHCHRICGTEAQGSDGPDLSHLGTRATLAAGLIENTPAMLGRWLEDPPALKPGTMMPAPGLTPEQIRNLADFLELP